MNKDTKKITRKEAIFKILKYCGIFALLPLLSKIVKAKDLWLYHDKVIIGLPGDTIVGDGTLRVFRPHTTLMIDLGTSSYYFNTAYINDLNLSGDADITGELTVGGDIIGSGTIVGAAFWKVYAPYRPTQVHAYSNVRPTDITGAKAYTNYSPYDFCWNVDLYPGWKVTKIHVYGEDSASTVTVYLNDCTDGTTATNKGAGTVNTELDITDVPYSATAYLTVGVNQGSSTTDEVFGMRAYYEPI